MLIFVISPRCYVNICCHRGVMSMLCLHIGSVKNFSILLQFPRGNYTSPKTVFDKLEEYGICVPRAQRLFPWFIIYDFEAMLVHIHGEESEKLSWTPQHVPISVSICSNVDGFTSPKCIVDPDSDTLEGSMVEYMQPMRFRRVGS